MPINVLPDGCAGVLLLWLPQLEPADESSPMTAMPHAKMSLIYTAQKYIRLQSKPDFKRFSQILR